MADGVEQEKVVIIDYADLMGPTTPSLRASIEKAYGYDGLGILAIRGVPGFLERRAASLPTAYQFGNLPEAVKDKYVHAESFYSFGWSHGKEKLEGKPDFAKGSFYFNPVHDRPVDDEATIKEHASFCHPNIWPSETDCPGFVDVNKACARLIVSVGAELARHCDDYVKSVDASFEEHDLNKIINYARCHKARLLYYFPMDRKCGADEDFSDWCGWHNDHGSLTGLTPAMYFDKDGNEIPCPDPKAGLYIRTRQGRTVRVAVPSDCIAYQIGETAQVHTGGILQATPHCVRAAEVPGVSRGTMAVFMEPEWSERMNAPAKAEADRVLRGARGELLPKGVPPLVDRWDTDGKQNFGEFSEKTLSMYY